MFTNKAPSKHNEKTHLEKAYQQYVIQSNLKRFRIASLLAVTLFPLGSLFDYFIYPSRFFVFLLIRILTSACCFLLFITSYTRFAKNHLSGFIIFLAIFVSIPIVTMVMLTGGHESGYYAGLILIIFATGLLFTLLTSREALIICGSIYLMYLVPILLFDDVANLPVFLNNNYFLSFVVVMALVSNYFNWKTRFSDFESFKTIENLNRHLNEKTQNLEKAMTELSKTQLQLVHSAKLASVGQLAAGVAHELNNALDIAVLGNICLKKTIPKIDEKAELAPTMQDIKSGIDLLTDGINRAHQVVKNLLTFSKKNAEGFKHQNVHEGIESSLQILNNELKNRVTVHKDYCEVREIFCDLSQLNQVFLNLLKNASDVIQNKGEIWIKTYRRDNYFCVSIRDNGPGIPEEYRDKIFDPFFTTKDVGKGTGLGLSVSYNIIKDHKGFIDFSTRTGEGTEFIIKLPIESSIEEETTHENAG